MIVYLSLLKLLKRINITAITIAPIAIVRSGTVPECNPALYPNTAVAIRRGSIPQNVAKI